MDRIFVQIASYRDTECQWTVKDLFDKAAHPDRVHVGICWQYDPEEDKDCFQIAARPEQVRISPFHWQESLGVCWARHQAQQLWQGEEYALLIDSHMRLAEGWDKRLIEQLAECEAAKPFLSNHPARYIPPDDLQTDAVPNILRAHPYTSDGNLRFRGDNLDRWPEKPLRGAFLAAGFIFSRGDIIRDVPYDPYMYFDQEEVSLAARLYTHGFDAFSLKNVLLYHYYREGPNPKQPRLHWEDNPAWRIMHDRARKRLDHLLEFEKTDDVEVLRELDSYGLGDARTLEDYQSFCGVDFKRHIVSEKALRCGFIPNLARYKNDPIFIPELDEPAVLSAPAPQISPPPRHKAPAQRTDDVLFIPDFVDEQTCDRLVAYLSGNVGRDGKLANPSVDGMISTLLPLCIQGFCDELSPFYHVEFEWLERPQARFFAPAAIHSLYAGTDGQSGDYRSFVFLHRGTEAGRIIFAKNNYSVSPAKGALLAFPATSQFSCTWHTASEGAHYAVAGLGVTFGSAYRPMPGNGVYLGQTMIQSPTDTGSDT